MQNSGLMRGRQTISDAGQQLGDILPIPRLPLSPRFESAAVNELRHQILPAGKFTHVIDAENMRMIERRRHLRFALKSPASRRIASQISASVRSRKAGRSSPI